MGRARTERWTTAGHLPRSAHQPPCFTRQSVPRHASADWVDHVSSTTLASKSWLQLLASPLQIAPRLLPILQAGSLDGIMASAEYQVKPGKTTGFCGKIGHLKSRYTAPADRSGYPLCVAAYQVLALCLLLVLICSQRSLACHMHVVDEVYCIKPNFCIRPKTGSCLIINRYLGGKIRF